MDEIFPDRNGRRNQIDQLIDTANVFVDKRIDSRILLDIQNSSVAE